MIDTEVLKQFVIQVTLSSLSKITDYSGSPMVSMDFTNLLQMSNFGREKEIIDAANKWYDATRRPEKISSFKVYIHPSKMVIFSINYWGNAYVIHYGFDGKRQN